MILSVSDFCCAEVPFALKEGDVVVFTGGTNMVRAQRAGYLETMLTHAFASSKPTFRDLSWEADTVFHQGSVIERWRKDGFGDRDQQLQRVGAKVVIAQFGQLESMAGVNGLDKFTKAYMELVDAFRQRATVVVLVTPTPFEKPADALIPDLSKRNADLALYVQSIAEIAESRKALFVDLFTNATSELTDNGMHVNAASQVDVARSVAEQLGVRLPVDADLEPLRLAVIEKHRLWYDYWRPANWKLLYGDDSARQFTRGGEAYIPFRQEWEQLVPLIAAAEDRVWQIANGGEDPGRNRPDPEVLHGDSSADIEKELASFSTPDDLQVNLFASELQGLTSPLNLRWDPAGRMYVTVTTTYPHVFPGDVPNDKIIVLEDTNGDGKADRSTVFADRLNIPTGLEIGEGGVFVGQNSELLFLKDNDGDGKADERRVVLSGFGNGDSHQTINSFVWSPDGEMYFGQGDGIESRVETPWGPSNLFRSGFYRLRPRRLHLLPFLDDHKGPGNPWGVAFDRWGQVFGVDGAGGVTLLTPAIAPTVGGPGYRKVGRIGEPGGYCGIGYLDGRHLPESMQGDFVIGDYKANRVKRFSVTPEDSGFTLQWKEPILHSRHRNFRPVDVKVGPDGAIYVVDWYNPITCHQDDAYRDPTRDKAHGRIWRVSAKAPTVTPPNLSKASLDVLFNALMSPEHWTRYQAKRALTERDPEAVGKSLDRWVRVLDPKSPEYEHHLLEALGAYATLEVVRPVLLRRLLMASDPRARAFATRIVGRWHDRLENPLELLTQRIADDHPQVRLEAVVACSAIASEKSIVVAAQVIDRPMDRWLSYALTQTVRHLRPIWMPSFNRGELSFEKPNHLASVLNEVGGKEALKSLRKLVESGELSAQARLSAIASILAVGSGEDLQDFGLDPKRFHRSGEYQPDDHADVLRRLVDVARFRDVRPDGDVAAALEQLMRKDHSRLKAGAIALAGIWKTKSIEDDIVAAAQNESDSIDVRTAAFDALVELQTPGSPQLLESFAADPNPPELRAAAIVSLAAVEMQIAARHAAELYDEPDIDSAAVAATMVAFLNRDGGAEVLASALRTANLKPPTAKQLLRSLFSTGRSDKALFDVISQAIGENSAAPDYSPSYVNQLVSEAEQYGQAKRGAVLFHSMACVSCHRIAGSGGTVGPDLTSIGTTLSGQRIVEELLWPDRQVKEGYSALLVLTNSGRLHTGFQRVTKASQQSGDLVLQDLASGKLTTIKQEEILEQRSFGSSMPSGLTAILSRPQLLDLIRYLCELGTLP